MWKLDIKASSPPEENIRHAGVHTIGVLNDGTAVRTRTVVAGTWVEYLGDLARSTEPVEDIRTLGLNVSVTLLAIR